MGIAMINKLKLISKPISISVSKMNGVFNNLQLLDNDLNSIYLYNNQFYTNIVKGGQIAIVNQNLLVYDNNYCSVYELVCDRDNRIVKIIKRNNIVNDLHNTEVKNTVKLLYYYIYRLAKQNSFSHSIIDYVDLMINDSFVIDGYKCRYDEYSKLMILYSYYDRKIIDSDLVYDVITQQYFNWYSKLYTIHLTKSEGIYNVFTEYSNRINKDGSYINEPNINYLEIDNSFENSEIHNIFNSRRVLVYTIHNNGQLGVYVPIIGLLGKLDIPKRYKNYLLYLSKEDTGIKLRYTIRRLMPNGHIDIIEGYTTVHNDKLNKCL